MFILKSHIEIGERLKFDFVTEVSIVSSWKQFTGTAEITIPRNIQVAETGTGIRGGIKNYVKQGDRVLIRLGYDDEINTEFEGFVTRIKPDVPLVIYCEDYMYHLKRVTITKTWRTVTLPELVKYLVDEYHKDTSRPKIEYKVTNTSSVGGLVVEKATILKVLDEIKTRGFYSFFRGNTLFVGFQSQFGTGKRHTFGFQENIVTSDLEYRMADDLRFKIKATSHKANGEKIHVEVGDVDGEHRTLQYYDVTKADLEKLAKEDLKKMKRTGYRGGFTSFGLPFVSHGDTVKIEDNQYPERDNETYETDTVKVSFGLNGFRRTIEPGYKAEA